MLGLWILIPPGEWRFVFRECRQVEVSTSGCSLVQRTPTECGVSECDHESSIMRKPWPAGGCCAMVKKNITWPEHTEPMQSGKYCC